MTDSGIQPNRQPWLEIGALLAQLSGVITGPIGIVLGWVLTARSHRWNRNDKTLAYVLAVPMGVLWFQPFGGGIGLTIDIATTLIAIGIALPLYRTAERNQETPSTHAQLRRSRRSTGTIAQVIGWSVTAAAGFAAWWIWMGWDHDDLYAAWQVIGSALTVLGVVLTAWWLLPNKITVSAVTIGYAAGWGASSMPGDESGMSGVGLIMVLCGLWAASTVLVVLADAVATSTRRTEPG